jgi:chemotaxis protein MotA
MFVIIGYIVVMVAVFGGYALAGGKFGVLAKAAPIELFIICGAAIGAFLVGNSSKSVKAVAKARKEGLIAIERDVEEPESSPIFQRYPEIASDHHLVEFITDYLRMMVSGNLNPHEIESLMDSEIDTHHQEAHGPLNSIAKLGDALPAFGIVAAVLGVVKTMASVGAAPAVLGGMIAGALVGTFLGILMAYGFVSPLASLLEQKADEAAKELVCVKTTLLASMQGYAPAIAVEFGRKVLFSTERPSFAELEQHVKQKKA